MVNVFDTDEPTKDEPLNVFTVQVAVPLVEFGKPESQLVGMVKVIDTVVPD